MLQVKLNSILECAKPTVFGRTDSYLGNHINHLTPSKPKQIALRVFSAQLSLSSAGNFNIIPNGISLRSLDLEENWDRRGFQFGAKPIEDIIDPDKPLYLTVPPYGNIYGHWIVDILPDLSIAKYLLPNMDIKLLHLPHCPEFGKQLSAQLGIPADGLVDITSIDVDALHQVISITPAREHDSFHASLLKRSFVNQLRTNSGNTSSSSADLIYVSRRAWRKLQPDTRSLSNRDEIEDLFKSHGFEIVYPETMSIAEQRNLFHRSAIMAGESGSGLHNSVFMGEKTKILCLQSGRQTHVIQSSLCALFNQSCHFIIGRHDNAEWHSNFDICPQAANDAIELAKKHLQHRVI